jgi:hypothetical protein
VGMWWHTVTVREKEGGGPALHIEQCRREASTQANLKSEGSSKPGNPFVIAPAVFRQSSVPNDHFILRLPVSLTPCLPPSLALSRCNPGSLSFPVFCVSVSSPLSFVPFLHFYFFNLALSHTY